MEFFRDPLEFEWDFGNQEKNLIKHRVTNAECEEVFFDPRKRILKEVFRPGGFGEKRYIVIGRTRESRGLYLVFTFRKSKIRVISARDLNRKERGLLP